MKETVNGTTVKVPTGATVPKSMSKRAIGKVNFQVITGNPSIPDFVF